MLSRPSLSLAQIDAFDPQGSSDRKCCPLCGEGKPRDAAHRSLSLDRVSGVWNCFRCGQGGKVQEAWRQRVPKQGASWPMGSARQAKLHAAFTLSEALPQRPPEVLPQQMTDPSCTLQHIPEPGRGETKVVGARGNSSVGGQAKGGQVPAPFDWRAAWEAAVPLAGTRGQAYLAGRYIPCALASGAGVRFCQDWHGSASLVFPINDRKGELVAVQGRAVRGQAKITHGPKKQGAFFAPVLFNESQTFEPLDIKVPAIVLVEAPLDALSVAVCGFPALALCGTSGPWWLHLACGLRHVMLAFDSDGAGDQAALSVEELLQPYGATCRRLLPQGFKDWNEWLCADARAMEGFLVSSLL